MKRFFLALALVLGCGSAARSQMSNAYITPDGAPSGVCQGAQTPTWFNTASNWGSGPNQIGPGTTVHLCGTFLGLANHVVLQVQGSGSASAPITILWEAGANIQSPTCGGLYAIYPDGTSNVGGCIVAIGKSYITFNGDINNGRQGVLKNTASGSTLSYQSPSVGMSLLNSNHIIVKNLTIGPIYVHNLYTDRILGTANSHECIEASYADQFTQDNVYCQDSLGGTHAFGDNVEIKNSETSRVAVSVYINQLVTYKIVAVQSGSTMNYTITGGQPVFPTTITYSAPVNPTPAVIDTNFGDQISVTNLIVNGVTEPSSWFAGYYANNSLHPNGGIEVFPDSFHVAYASYGEQLYSGTETNPTLLAGTWMQESEAYPNALTPVASAEKHLTGLTIHDNHFHDGANWATDSYLGISYITIAPSFLNSVNAGLIYNNLLDGDMGAYPRLQYARNITQYGGIVLAGNGSIITPSTIDNFNRANVSPLGSPWVNPGGASTGTFQLLGNQVSPATTANQMDLAINSSYSATATDYYAQISVTALKGGAGHVGLCLRCSPTGNNEYLVELDASSPTAGLDSLTPLNVQKIVGGVFQNQPYHSFGYVTPKIGDIFRAQISGNTISVYQNEILVGSFVDTNAPISTGNPGIYAQTVTGITATSDLAIDNFGADAANAFGVSASVVQNVSIFNNRIIDNFSRGNYGIWLDGSGLDHDNSVFSNFIFVGNNHANGAGIFLNNEIKATVEDNVVSGGQSDIVSVGSTFKPNNASVLTPIATDSFTRANENPVNSNWTARPADVKGQIISNQLVGNGTGNSSNMYYTAAVFTADQYSQARLQTLVHGNGTANLLVRGSTTTAALTYLIYLDANVGGMAVSTPLNIYAGNTKIASVNVTPQVNDLFRAQVVGNLITVYQNNRLVLSVTDTTISVGYPGIAASVIAGSATNVAWTNWEGGTAQSSGAGAVNNNVYYNLQSDFLDNASFSWNGATFPDLASWQVACACDYSSVFSTAAQVHANANGQPITNPNSSMLGIGLNLTSLGITPLTFDAILATRPASGPWTVGAYQNAILNVSRPLPPLNVTSTPN